MEPIRTIQLAIQFAAGVSPAWLIPALPAVLLTSFWLCRRSVRAVQGPNRIGLILLRLGIMGTATVLLFRPSLVFRETLTFPGRVVLIEDDSGSMGVADSHLPSAEAVALARAVGLEAGDGIWGEGADRLATARRILQEHERRAEESAHRGRSFWIAADEARGGIEEILGWIERMLERRGEEGFEGVREALGVCRDVLPRLFEGPFPLPEDRDVFLRNASSAETLLRDFQARTDEQVCEKNPAVRQAAEAIRRRTRRELVSAFIARHENGWREILAPLKLHRMRLSEQQDGAEDERGFETPLADTLQELMEKKDPFPLAAVVFFSDGRDTSAAAAETVAEKAARLQIPLLAIGVGWEEEPPDLAVASVHAAPFAIVGEPFPVQVRLKTPWPEPALLPVELRQGDTVLDTAATNAGPLWGQLTLTYTPTSPGLIRLTIQLPELPAEAVPRRNNRMDLAVRVRPERLRVLVLDDTPRWETRFLLNIWGRLNYVRLHPIIVATQPDGTLLRGSGFGHFPGGEETLALYDLIVLGHLSEETFRAEEWDRMRHYVEKGGTLCLIAPEGGGFRAPSSWREAILPLGVGPPPPNLSSRDVRGLEPYAEGASHPLSRAFAREVQILGECSDPRLRAETIPLAGRPEWALLTVRFAGSGKVFLLDSDALWRLNDTRREEHGRLFIHLLQWAVEAQAPQPGRAAPDGQVAETGQGLQVWVRRGVSFVEAGSSRGVGEVRAAVLFRENAPYGRAVFNGLSAGEWFLRPAGEGGEGERVIVLERSGELVELGRDDRWLRGVTQKAGGSVLRLTEAADWAARIPPKTRVERRDRIWRLWDSGWVLATLAVGLTAEWIWRKWIGLV